MLPLILLHSTPPSYRVVTHATPNGWRVTCECDWDVFFGTRWHADRAAEAHTESHQPVIQT